MSDNEEFQSADAGAALTYPCQAGSIKKGSHVMLKGNPCKCVEYTTSKTGKHGHAKAHIIGLDIFTNKKCEDLCPTSHNLEVPIVTRKTYQLISVDDDFVSYLDENQEIQSHLKMPTNMDGSEDDVAKQLRQFLDEDKEIQIAVVSAVGQEKIVEVREARIAA